MSQNSEAVAKRRSVDALLFAGGLRRAGVNGEDGLAGRRFASLKEEFARAQKTGQKGFVRSRPQPPEIGR